MVDQNTKFNYLLNAMENAAHEKYPAKAGYAGKRVALLEHVRELERKAAAFDALGCSMEKEQGDATRAHENTVQQAQGWAMEARTQRDTVLSILRYFGLPEHDWEALSLIREKIEGAPVSQEVKHVG